MAKKFKSFKDLQKELHPEDHKHNLIKESRRKEAIRKRQMGIEKGSNKLPTPSRENLLRTWAVLRMMMAESQVAALTLVADRLDKYFEEHKMFSRVNKITSREIVFDTNEEEEKTCHKLLTRFGKKHGMSVESTERISSPEEVV